MQNRLLHSNFKPGNSSNYGFSSASYVVRFISVVAAVIHEANCGNHDDQIMKEDNVR